MSSSPPGGDFETQVHDALAHLYDFAQLQKHPLTRLVGNALEDGSPARTLRRLLLDAIQELKPVANAPVDTHSASSYQVLYLRYVQGQSVTHIARQLSLTERQVYRRQRDALQAVSAALAGKLPRSVSASSINLTDSTSATVAASPNIQKEVADEVDRLGRTGVPAPVDLLTVLDGALATIGGLAEKNRPRLVREVIPHLPQIMIERTALRQALVELLLFAFRYPDAARIGVTADADSTRVNLRLAVTCGSPIGQLPVTEDDSLVIGRRLIELQSGRVLDVTKDQTRTIVVELPVARPRTVLIVDDSADTRQLFERYLDRHVERTILASSGTEAIQVMNGIRPDAVILDVMLPGIDGWEVLQTLRSHPDSREVPVVVCTVLKHQDLARSLGATAFVTKPVTKSELLAALEQCWALDR